jgi:dipeptidase D
LCQSLFQNVFQAESTIHVVHAGLGFIGGKYPGLDMVSFGPMICGAHAPGERAEIASVHRCWQLFAAIQAAVP